MVEIMWKADQKQIVKSNMTKFIHFVNRNFHLSLSNYHELYDWSVQNSADFWQSIWSYCGIIASKPAEKILVEADRMEDTKWFEGAELNFAQNLLRRKDNKIALIFQNENGFRTTYSYAQLYSAVAKVAGYLRQLGVKKNDRIAAVLPNMPETIIAMLATTSMGAIWSSCSPDFGKEGLLDRFSQITPKILFTCDAYPYNGKIFNIVEKIQEVANKISSLEKIILIKNLKENGAVHFEQDSIEFDSIMDGREPALEFEQLPFAHPVYIMYSSGTTGMPKCIVHGAGTTLLQHLKELVLHTDLSDNDNIFYFTTCGWMMWNWYISSLAIGATVTQYDGSASFPTYSRLFDFIDQEKITVFGTSAKYISTIEQEKLTPKKTHQLTQLRTILSSGSPLIPKNFEYIYKQVKKEVCLSSISGGTDIISCFALGNPILPVYRGELQCIGLGMKVEIFNEEGQSIIGEKGELVCTKAFPSMPIYFWNDEKKEKYHNAYFTKFPNVWAHGDFAEITERGTLVIYGRSDATLNPSGIRIGTAEIYRQVEKLPEIVESVAVAQEWGDDVRIILFVILKNTLSLTDDLKNKITKHIRENCSPRHVPAKIIQVPDIPRTLNGKVVELAVREIIHNRPVKNISAITNPESLDYFKDVRELKN